MSHKEEPLSLAQIHAKIEELEAAIILLDEERIAAHTLYCIRNTAYCTKKNTLDALISLSWAMAAEAKAQAQSTEELSKGASTNVPATGDQGSDRPGPDQGASPATTNNSKNATTDEPSA